jgi:MoaA/NifB/PqqE/SkfB family radical SAM enzyme
MINLSWLLEKSFQLHGMIPRWLWRDGRAFLPIHMMIEVTYRCNLRCNFCHYLEIIEGKVEPHGPSKGDLSFEDITRYVSDLPRGRLVSFAGGETLVRKDFPRILEHAAARHRVHIITNGSLIDEKVARSYIDLAPRYVWQTGLVLVEVSLEGTEDAHDRVVKRPGSWRRSVGGMRHLVRLRAAARKRFPKFDFKLVVTRDTVGTMVEFMHLARDVGVDLVNFLAEHELMRNAEGGKLDRLHHVQQKPEGVDHAYLREQLIRCHELARDWGLHIRLTPNVPIDEFVRHYTDDRSLDPSEYACEGPWSRLGVNGDGRYSPMCFYADDGDMRREDLRELWNGERLRSFRRATREARVYAGCHGCCNLKYIGDKPFGLAGVDQAGLSAPA